jgi:TonB family protein
MRYLSVALLFVASTAVAQNWQQVASLDSNGGVLFVDASDIMEVKGYRRAWFKWAYGTDQPVPGEYRESVPKAKTYRWVQSANLFHCTEQTTAIAEQRWFNSEDKELGSRRPEALQFLKVSSGTVDQQMLEAVCSSESVRSRERLEEQAQMTRPVQPKEYYPKGSILRGEQGTATVKVCVDSTGRLLDEPVVTVSSGFPELDGAALQVAKDSRYKPGVREGAVLPESCLEVPVAFRQQKNFPELPTLEARVMKPANPHDYFPRDARRREEQGSPVVQACVGRNGKLVRDPVITESSGSPALDAAAIEVARATRYAPGRIAGIAAPESCIKFRVKF